MIFLKRYKKYCHTSFNLYINEVTYGVYLVHFGAYYTLYQTINNTHYAISSDATRGIDKSIRIHNIEFSIYVSEHIKNDELEKRYVHYNRKGKKCRIDLLRRELYTYIVCAEDGDYIRVKDFEYGYYIVNLATGVTQELKITPEHKLSMQKHLLFGLNKYV